MNPLDVIREKLDACFIFNSYAPPEVKKLTGVSMLSQIWIDVPAWYFWLHDVPGAFMLEAVKGDAMESDGITFDSAVFKVRYFPPTGSDNLDTFTERERHLRNTDLFDSTGTPVYDLLNVVREGYFEYATLEFHFSRSDDNVIMVLSVPRAGNRVGKTSRESICTALYESLAGMYSLYYQSAPESSYLFQEETDGTVLLALVFSKEYPKKAKRFMQNYMVVDQLDPFIRQSARENNWHELAHIKPESMPATGCGCCCGH
jgi:hypothetical protein